MRVFKETILIGMIILSLILGSATLTRGHDWGDDFAWYILQAKSIWNGTTADLMKQSAFTNTQSTTYVGPLAYPWGYPLILTPVYAFKGTHPLALKMPGLFFYAAFLICFFYLMKPRLPWTENLILVSLFAFNPLLIQFLDQILSDIPFLFFSTLTLLLMTRGEKRGTLQNVLMGVSVFLTFFLRATGIFLLGSFLIVEFFKLLSNRKDRNMVIKIVLDSFMICFVFVLLVAVNIFLFPSGGQTSYLSQFAGLSMETLRHSLYMYFNVFALFFGNAPAWMYLYYLLIIFSLLGAWTRRKQEPIFIVFFVIWMIVHVTYPYWQGPRYIFPLLPIFIYFAFQGMKFSIGKLPETSRLVGQRVFYGFWFAIIGYFLFTSGTSAFNNVRNGRQINGPFDSQSMEVYDWIDRKTPADSVLIFYKARAMRLMTGHPTIMINECDGMLKGDYLILSKKVERNNQIPVSEIDSCNLPIDKRFENRRFIIYEIVK